MDRPQKEFGDYIKELRRAKQKTLDEVSKVLGVSLSFLSDIENKRRNPFDEEKIELLAKYLMLTSNEKATMYDLAAKRKHSVPDDVKEVIMYAPASDFVRLALRKTKAGELSEKDWQDFIELHDLAHNKLNGKKEGDGDA